MKLRTALFSISIPFLFLTACTSTPSRTELTADVRQALSLHFPPESRVQYNSSCPVEPLALPALERALPNRRFFRTTLPAGYMEYPEVQTAIALRLDVTPRTITTCYSPTFADPDQPFLDLFRGAPAASPADQLAVGRDIAALFASITYAGNILAPKLSASTFTAELWHHDMFWRQIIINFDQDRVTSITLRNPAHDPPDSHAFVVNLQNQWNESDDLDTSDGIDAIIKADPAAREPCDALRRFLAHLAHRDIDAAYALVAPSAKRDDASPIPADLPTFRRQASKPAANMVIYRPGRLYDLREPGTDGLQYAQFLAAMPEWKGPDHFSVYLICGYCQTTLRLVKEQNTWYVANPLALWP